MTTPMKYSRIKTLFGRSTAVLLCSAGIVLAAAHAQDTTSAPPPPPAGQQGPPPNDGPGGPGGGRGGMNPERRIEMLQKHLKLTDDQTAQVKTIFSDERSKTEALRANTALSRPEMRSQMMAITQDRDTRMHSLLNPGQSKKYDEMVAKERERMMERRGNGQQGAPPAAPPPAL